MIVIIEGLDRCGKSTLVNQLRKDYFKNPNIIIHHSSSPPKIYDPNVWEITHYSNLFKLFTSLYDYDIILDRFHLGAIVYGKKYRNADPKNIYDIDNEYLQHNKNIVLILLTDNIENIISRDDGLSLEQNKEDFEETKNAFAEAFNNSKCINKLSINISDNGGFEQTYPTVVAFLDRAVNANSN